MSGFFRIGGRKREAKRRTARTELKQKKKKRIKARRYKEHYALFSKLLVFLTRAPETARVYLKRFL